jgi:hypothetical protein
MKYDYLTLTGEWLLPDSGCPIHHNLRRVAYIALRD